MKRLVVVSNRVADPDCRAWDGLAVYLLDGLRTRGGVWLGWSGELVASETEICAGRNSLRCDLFVEFEHVQLSRGA